MQSSKDLSRGRSAPDIREVIPFLRAPKSFPKSLLAHRRLRMTLVKRSMRAKAHSCFGAWNAPGFYIECSSCSSSRRSAGWAVRQTVRTKSTEKRQLGANNLCYVPSHRFPLYPRLLSFLLSSSFLSCPSSVMSFAQDLSVSFPSRQRFPPPRRRDEDSPCCARAMQGSLTRRERNLKLRQAAYEAFA